jgi:nucleoid DNA-binding protein/LysM repeat protein
MNEKLSFQNIADTLARKAGVQKKVAETFSKAFFDTIVEAVSAGDVVKIKGLGTFKLIEVGDRESVNVSTGMRFVILGYKKLSFTAEDHVVEVLNPQAKNEEEVTLAEDAHTESVVVAEPVMVAEPIKTEAPIEMEEPKEEEDIETFIQVPEPEQVETPQDAFAGIDMLISTPESVDDIRQQYEAAKAKMETAVEEARKANAEKVRLEKLLERLEKNVEPEVVPHTEKTEKGVSVETVKDTNPVSAIPVTPANEKADPSVETFEEEKRQAAFNRVMTEPSHSQEEKPQSKPSSNKRFWLTVLIILLLAVLGVFIYLIHRNIEAVEKVHTVEQTTKPAKKDKSVQPAKSTKPVVPKADKDSLVKAQKADSVKVAPEPQKEASKPDAQKPEVQKPAKEERPKTHRMQRGESLTRVSQKYYGTKDSVRAILRINTFADPNNIPVGAVVKLP